MKIIEVGTGYTSIPAKMGAATEIVVEEIAKAFQKENINYIIYDIKDENRAKTDLNIQEVTIPGFLRKKDTSLGIIHKLKRVCYSLSLAKALRKEIRKSQEEIAIHFHNQYNMYFFMKTTSKKLRKKVKIFYTVHSYIWSDEWTKIEKTIKTKYFQESYSVKHADKVFVLNEITKQHFINYLNIDSKRIVMIDNGVNINIYKPANKKQKKDIIQFFQCGSICDRKNQMESIIRLTPYMKKNKNIQFVYAGGIIDSEYQNQINDYVDKNDLKDQVIYLGEINPGEELNEYYASSRALMFPSKSESFGMVVIEAMSAGLPVITNYKPLVNILNKLDNNLLIYENDKDFSNIIDNYILDETKRQNISNNVRKTIIKSYSWDKIAKDYYDEIIK